MQSLKMPTDNKSLQLTPEVRLWCREGLSTKVPSAGDLAGQLNSMLGISEMGRLGLHGPLFRKCVKLSTTEGHG